MIPWQSIPISDVRGVMPRNVDRLAKAGVHTLADLERFTREGWQTVDAVLGRGTGRRIDAAVSKFFELHPDVVKPTGTEQQSEAA
jgi:hypothetical protein